MDRCTGIKTSEYSERKKATFETETIKHCAFTCSQNLNLFSLLNPKRGMGTPFYYDSAALCAPFGSRSDPSERTFLLCTFDRMQTRVEFTFIKIADALLRVTNTWLRTLIDTLNNTTKRQNCIQLVPPKTLNAIKTVNPEHI